MEGTVACRSCGMCVASCPQRAVEFPGYSADEIESHVDTLIGSADEPLNIVFACKKSTNLPGDDCQVVPVAYAAMVPTAALLNTTAMGAKSARILRCTGQCDQTATSDLEGRIGYVQEILERVGDDSKRHLTGLSSCLETRSVTTTTVRCVPNAEHSAA